MPDSYFTEIPGYQGNYYVWPLPSVHQVPCRTVLKRFLKYFFQGFKVAYVVFGAAGSVQKAKKMSFNDPYILSTDEYSVDVGLKSMYRISSILKKLLI